MHQKGKEAPIEGASSLPARSRSTYEPRCTSSLADRAFSALAAPTPVSLIETTYAPNLLTLMELKTVLNAMSWQHRPAPYWLLSRYQLPPAPHLPKQLPLHSGTRHHPSPCNNPS